MLAPPRTTPICSRTRMPLERLRLYAIGFDVRELLAFPPEAPAANLSPDHALNRLLKTRCPGRSYLDNFARSDARW